jgi:8-oxo-dGTP pyrophosphatase MutT (NUDIX family)
MYYIDCGDEEMKLLKIFDRRKTKLGAQPIIYRNAVRAIILKGDKVLMVYSERSKEFKFPGGGIEHDESREEALKRETVEEVGHIIKSVNESLGYVDQLYNDIYEDEKYFYQRSYYYFCEIEDEYVGMKLSESELALRFLPKWVPLDEAIRVNQYKVDNDNEFPWTERELYVLKILREMTP